MLQMAKRKSKHKASNMVPDFELWARVSKTIVAVNPELAAELALFEKNNHPKQLAPKVKAPSVPQTVLPQKQQLNNSVALEYTGLDRRKQRRLLRGQVEIEGRLDLHGESVASAREKLLNFLEFSAFQNKRTVLVITGKGEAQFSRHTLHSRDFHDSSDRTGRLRKEVPFWFSEPQFRMLISGYQPAHPKHGGGGAMYVQLRNMAKRNKAR